MRHLLADGKPLVSVALVVLVPEPEFPASNPIIIKANVMRPGVRPIQQMCSAEMNDASSVVGRVLTAVGFPDRRIEHLVAAAVEVSLDLRPVPKELARGRELDFHFLLLR